MVAALLLGLHDRHRNVLVVVTHSLELAARLPICFDLVDGRLERRPSGQPRPSPPEPDRAGPTA
jgi:predicted ABC-type transport system involved in lysophospholipase L1 biosynthesis ATPase subunit